MYNISHIKHKLMKFEPSELNVFDDSEKHRGHAGYSDKAPSHIRIEITSAAFEGLSKLAVHRMIHEALKDELEAGLHSLAINARTSDIKLK
ncbi:MAG: BolA family protein [Pseudomonadota bacterium]